MGHPATESVDTHRRDHIRSHLHHPNVCINGQVVAHQREEVQDVARQLRYSTVRSTAEWITNTVGFVRLVDPAKLMGAAEIRTALGGVGETRGIQITSRPDFPRPIRTLRMGQIWDGDEVEAWIAEHRRPADDAEGEPGID
jgi:hypothetical protein